MPGLRRPDGVDLHWEERGDGLPVVLAPYWSGHPGVYEALLSELASDHRVIAWDARGTGESTRAGPYDMETDCADLEAILDRAGGGALVIAIADGTNRAVRVAARRPDLVAAVATLGTAPFALTPEAHVLEGHAGPISRPAKTAALVRGITESLRLQSGT